MDNDYVWFDELGELSGESFIELVRAFPQIFAVKTKGEFSENASVICGCSAEIEDKLINMYRLIVTMWKASDEEIKRVCEAFGVIE